MAKVERGEVIQEVIRKLRLNSGLETTPSIVEDKIRAVIDVEPKPMVNTTTGTASDATTATILTTSTSRRSFLTYCSLSVAKSVLATSLFSDIAVFPRGKASSTVLRIRYEPVTAGEFTNSINFDTPIELEPGTIVTVTNTTTTSSIDSSGTVGIYELEDD